ncbi:DUF6212 domain-containing protein [Kordiimonas laminariae]|uniref:DUF6212 domain-containing protein n=1 Tax=Kordiimonas laminariae TaxID=2917717 RepID=UPI001FF5E79C|nr:DUF6212 domain-containing protein [Kordiimonas laminariae]MCK0067979.1 hypothetical protein [Kordiimonas laminariae]
MFTFRVTREALSSFYAAPVSLLVSADLFANLKSVFPKDLTVFCLDANGRISSKGSRNAKTTFQLSGMPTGMVGVVTSPKHRALGEEVCRFATYHGAGKPLHGVITRNPVNALLPGLDSAKVQFTKFINGLMAKNLGDLRTILGQKEQQLVHFRRRNEQLWLGGEKARRMIAGIGFSSRSVSFELLPSEESIKLDSLPDNKYSQVLPTDLAGFAGLSLYVKNIPDVEGQFVVAVTRSADNAMVGNVSVPFHSLKEGWNDFSMSYAIPLTFGNGVITVSSNSRVAPEIMLAEGAVDRFGIDHSSIALRVYKGLEDPSAATGENKDLNEEVARFTAKCGPMLEFAKFSTGDTAEADCAGKIDGPLYRADLKEGWLAAQLVQKKLVGLTVPKRIQKHVSGVSLSLSRVKAGDTPVLVAVVVSSSLRTPEAVHDFFESLGSERSMSGREEGTVWSALVMSSNDSAELSVRIRDSLSETADLLLLAKPLGDSNHLGRLRWHQLTTEVKLSPADVIREIPAEQKLMSENSKLQVRASRFSEILGQVEFYNGLNKQQELTDKYGFSPLMVSEGTGAMQTHPLSEELSATVMSGGAVVGARRIMAEIGTGHESAPNFTYIMMVLPTDVQNRREVIEEIAEKVRDGVHNSSEPESGVFWSSLTVKPMCRCTLSIGFGAPRVEAGDVVFAVISLDGNISFGWCNWYLFANITEGYEHPVNILSAPEDSD